MHGHGEGRHLEGKLRADGASTDRQALAGRTVEDEEARGSWLAGMSHPPVPKQAAGSCLRASGLFQEATGFVTTTSCYLGPSPSLLRSLPGL